jgi:hypothetical protein
MLQEIFSLYFPRSVVVLIEFRNGGRDSHDGGSGVNNKNSTNRYRFQTQSGRGGMMKTLLIDVDPQGSGGSDTAGTPQQRTDYYLS